MRTDDDGDGQLGLEHVVGTDVDAFVIEDGIIGIGHGRAPWNPPSTGEDAGAWTMLDSSMIGR